jgi:hypothetical protein
MRPDNLRLRGPQIYRGRRTVAYNVVMEVEGQNVRPEALEERRKRLSKLLRCSNKAVRDGIQPARR